MYRRFIFILLIALLSLPTRPARAFEQFPRSLAWELKDVSGDQKDYYDGKHLVGTYYAKAGDTINMWATVVNRSRNPQAEVWYGRNALAPEGASYPNAHAIGVGMWVPFDQTPSWVDPSSFVINGNRLMYYDGPPVGKNYTVTLNWQLKIAPNTPDGQYDLVLNLVREFDEWGRRVDSLGRDYKYQSMYWKIVVGEVKDKYVENTLNTSAGSFATQVVEIRMDNPNLKIMTDTAVSTENTPAPWPVASLKSFVEVNGADIGIHGSYFWPAAYGGDPAKANTFNPMVYNSRIGRMINEARNGGNRGGLLIFGQDNKPYYFLKTSEFKSSSWFESTYGTKVQAAISNVPTLVYHGTVNYGDGDLDSNMTTVKATRAAIGVRDNIIYLAIVNNATVLDLAEVMRTMQMDYALNLDGGGSTALYYHGQFKAGPGRDIANAILFKV